MLKFTLIAAALDDGIWNACKGEINNILKRCKTDHVEIGAGLWVFSNADCYGAVVEVIHALRANGLSFVALPFDTPLPVGLKSEQKGVVLAALEKLDVEVWKID